MGSEVPRDLLDGDIGITAAGDAGHVFTELFRLGPGHGRHPSGRCTRSTDRMPIERDLQGSRPDALSV